MIPVAGIFVLREVTEVEADDGRDEQPEHREEFALRNQVRLAGFVNEFGDFQHRLVNGQIFELSVHDEAEHQACDRHGETDVEQVLAADAPASHDVIEKCRRVEVGQFQVGFACVTERGAEDYGEHRRDKWSRQTPYYRQKHQ